MPVSGLAFICHSSHDDPYVAELESLIRGLGYEAVFNDVNSIVPDSLSWPAIENAIRKCDAFVVVATPNAERSRWVARELHLARSLGKKILPLWIAGERPDFLFENRDIIDLRSKLTWPLKTGTRLHSDESRQRTESHGARMLLSRRTSNASGAIRRLARILQTARSVPVKSQLRRLATGQLTLPIVEEWALLDDDWKQADEGYWATTFGLEIVTIWSSPEIFARQEQIIYRHLASGGCAYHLFIIDAECAHSLQRCRAFATVMERHRKIGIRVRWMSQLEYDRAISHYGLNYKEIRTLFSIGDIAFFQISPGGNQPVQLARLWDRAEARTAASRTRLLFRSGRATSEFMAWSGVSKYEIDYDSIDSYVHRLATLESVAIT